VLSEGQPASSGFVASKTMTNMMSRTADSGTTDTGIQYDTSGTVIGE
jgi:hypothetical protein